MDKKTLIKAMAAEFTRAVREYDAADAGSAREDEALAIQGSINRMALSLGVADELDRALRKELGGYGPVLSFELEEVAWT